MLQAEAGLIFLNYHKGELYCLSQNIIRVIKSRKLRRAGRRARLGERNYAHRFFFWVTPEGKIQSVIPRRRWGLILKRIFKKWGGDMDWINLATRLGGERTKWGM